MTPSQKKEIEKRFDEKFCVSRHPKVIGSFFIYNEDAEKIKEFWFSTLDQAFAEQKEEIKKSINGMPRKEECVLLKKRIITLLTPRKIKIT